MNKFVELKFMRSIVVHFFGHTKVIELDDIYYGVKKLKDEDCRSLIDIMSLIKIGKLLPSVETMIYIYENLFPNIRKESIEIKKVELLYNKIKKIESYKEIIEKGLFEEAFHDFSFCLLSFYINILHYKKFKTFFVIPLAMSVSLKKNFLENRERFYKQLEKLVEINQDYHIKRKIFSFETICNKIFSIPKEDLSFFGIKQVYLFGSYAKKRVNEYSDLDFHILVDKIKDCLPEQSDFISSYLTHLFNSRVDVKVYHITNILDENSKALFNNEIKIPIREHN